MENGDWLIDFFDSLIKWLISAYVEILETGDWFIYWYQNIVEILESGEVNPNTEDPIGFSPLMRAAQQDKTK